MKSVTRLLVVLALMVAAFTVAAQDDDNMMMELPEEIVFEAPGITPEGIEYDAANARFLVGSLTDGNIRAVMDDGSIEVFIEDEFLVASIGIHIDADGERLLVANSNPAVFSGTVPEGFQIGLAAYDLNTGEQLFAVDLTELAGEGTHFANDVTVDEDGNAYVTDSFAPVIYQVTPDGEASIFIENENLGAEGFGLNGIDYSPDGYLLAAVAGAGAIFKIPLDDPEALMQVELETALGIDGMALAEDGTVYAVARVNGAQQIVEIMSEDEWETATITNSVPTTNAATTLALRDGAVYYINAYLNTPDQEEYEIVRADFDMMMDDMGGDDTEEMEEPEPATTEEAAG
ncbi:MAG: SMP-30/gluconolactonase/LRE family protein [Anaerolineae bacterium]